MLCGGIFESHVDDKICNVVIHVARRSLEAGSLMIRTTVFQKDDLVAFLSCIEMKPQSTKIVQWGISRTVPYELPSLAGVDLHFTRLH